MSNKKAIITLRDVGVRYDSTVALEHVDLEIFDNDFLGIIGPNGGGKSSLVKAIMGIVSHSGTVEYDKAIMHHGKPHIGYMPQITAFDKAFPISVEEVVMSGLQREHGMLRRYSNEERKRVKEVLELASLNDLSKRAIATCDALPSDNLKS